MGRKSLTKGKVGEREVASELRRLFGVDARRGRQYSGGSDSPDVVADIPGIHLEVKRCERLSLYAAMRQSAGDAGTEKVPVVLHRQNREEWLVVVRLNDMPELIDRFACLKDNEECMAE